jgi:hypothetical protein
VTKVHFVRDEKNKCVGLLRKYEDVHVDDVIQQAALYEHEREYLYAKAFRSAPDWDPQLFSTSGLSRRFSMHPSTSNATTTAGYRSHKQGITALRLESKQRHMTGALLQVLRMHEALSEHSLALHDVNANAAITPTTSMSPEAKGATPIPPRR